MTNGPLMEDIAWLNIVYLHNEEHTSKYIKGAFFMSSGDGDYSLFISH